MSKTLSDRKLQSKLKAGRYFDNNQTGLHLHVRESGSKAWVQRARINKKYVDLGLGNYPAVSLQKARQLALKNKSLIIEGKDPRSEKTNYTDIPTFKQVALLVIEKKKTELSNAKSKAQWTSTIETYALPVLGSLRIDQILDQHIRCPKCFYLQRKLGLKPPAMVPLTLAVATDALLKNEFDAVRETGSSHPLWEREGLNVRAYKHEDIDLWRNNFKGIRITHSSGTEIFGAVDDVWENLDTGELHIVDYKSTSKQGEPSIDVGWGDSYKRQMEIYQWLFREAGYTVSSIGYFLYVNGSKEGGFYDHGTNGVMRFATTMIAYEGDDAWVSGAVDTAVDCLHSDTIPASGSDCDNCRYYIDRQKILRSKI